MRPYPLALFIVLTILLAVPFKTTSAGFFDQVIKEAIDKEVNKQIEKHSPPKKEPPPADDYEQKSNSNNGGLIGGLGGMLGVSQKNLNLVNKGIQTLQAMQPIDEEAEKILGESVALEAFSRYGGLYNNKALTKYVNLVGKTVVEVSSRPDLEYHFAILNSKQLNAFAAPGGYIFVTKGLLANLRNEAELATILAHEIAHVDHKHMLKTLQRSSLLSNVSELSLTVMNKDPKMLSDVIDKVSNLLFTHGIDKKLEHEADYYGVKYAYDAGYSPNSIANYLKRLKKRRGKSKSVFFTTHPPISERINRVENQLSELDDSAKLAVLQKRFARHMKSL
ncbi:MAG: M48 family metalloprotease [Magnetococcales bacterium]|nr:M48 family metalloprotease [Magnetococcales bacterium]